MDRRDREVPAGKAGVVVARPEPFRQVPKPIRTNAASGRRRTASAASSRPFCSASLPRNRTIVRSGGIPVASRRWRRPDAGGSQRGWQLSRTVGGFGDRPGSGQVVGERLVDRDDRIDRPDPAPLAACRGPSGRAPGRSA